MTEVVIARYDLTNLGLAALLLIVGFPAFVFGAPFFSYDDYQSFFEGARRGYSWILLMALAPFSALVGALLIVDAVRARGAAIILRGDQLVFGGPWRTSVPLDRIDRVEAAGKPYGVRVWWEGSRERGFNTLLMRPRREAVRDEIIAVLARRRSA